MKFLLNVGAEKAGTTWLHSYFESHPEFKSIGKELNAIQRDDFVPTFVKDWGYKSNIDAYFSKISNMNCVTGDFTHYEGSTENIFRILKGGFKTYDIDVVPVYIMRDPIERAWSSWHMLMRAAKACGIRSTSSEGFDMPVAAIFTLKNYLECKYKETIQALDNIFPKPLYFFYEEFFKQEDVNLICDNMSIQRHPVLEQVINKGNYDNEIPEQFIEMFGNTPKHKEAVNFVRERFGHVPWDVTRY